MIRLSRLTTKVIVFFLILMCFYTLNIFPTNATELNWQEVSTKMLGRQWWDRGSLKKFQDGHLLVRSKYSPAIDKNQPEEISYIYDMEIDCDSNLFKDIATNNRSDPNSAWRSPDGDELIEQLIHDVCIVSKDLLFSE